MPITFWTRIEPLPRSGDMKRSLQAEVRDPLWTLLRQLQWGELTGDDAGSPVMARVEYTTAPLSGYQPGVAASTELDPTVPLEPHVEREDIELGLKGSVELGIFLEKLLPPGLVSDFRKAFPIAPKPTSDEIHDAQALAFRALVAGRVVDGEAAYWSYAGRKGAPPLPASASGTPAKSALDRLKNYRTALFTTPSHDSAWDRPYLDYEFAVSSDVSGLKLSSDHFPGGRLDWYSFSASSYKPTAPKPASTVLTFVPTHVLFRGGPTDRWWKYEDGLADYGNLDTEHVDLGRLLVMEFAIVYGSDWYQFPIQLDIGSLCQIDTLVVTDTFGRMVQIPSTSDIPAAGSAPWSLFRLSGTDAAKDILFLPPVLGRTIDAPELEDVLFLRDDVAAMAWAVEKTLQGPLDRPVDGYETFLQRLRSEPPPDPPQPIPGGPSIWYSLGTTVPDNWIPFVPVTAKDGSLMLRRGKMARAVKGVASSADQTIPARGHILEPGTSPYLLFDRAVPQAGAEVARYFRRTRWSDGSTLLWIARRSRPGKGPGWAGLQFDVISPMGKGPDLVHP